MRFDEAANAYELVQLIRQRSSQSTDREIHGVHTSTMRQLFAAAMWLLSAAFIAVAAIVVQRSCEWATDRTNVWQAPNAT
jgi:hypothetical protein